MVGFYLRHICEESSGIYLESETILKPYHVLNEDNRSINCSGAAHYSIYHTTCSFYLCSAWLLSTLFLHCPVW